MAPFKTTNLVFLPFREIKTQPFLLFRAILSTGIFKKTENYEKTI